ncbi:MAG: plasmid stabilization protein [Bacteroidetes bacterium RIFCSPLOWO2_12_FULL_31_6]|nr:MAG: plasmid stabilization protein [Bacteroidetes bacterium RIFCSPLOWO2_12_FULL_31_6]
MAKFKFTNSAVKDLSDIWEYTTKFWSEKQAEKYYRLIIQDCTELAKNPQTGKDYSEIYPKLLGQKTSRHIIFYRLIDKSTIEITRILHERMDLKNRLK